MKTLKNFRTLDIYTRFCEGKVIRKEEEVLRFCVDKRTIQRDIDDIRAFLAERIVNGSANKGIEYSHKEKGFIMVDMSKMKRI